MRHLHQSGRASFGDVFASFVDFCKKHPSFPLIEFYESSLADRGHCGFSFWGKITHLVLHEQREDFNVLLHRFVTSQSWWDDDVEACFEIDLVNKPFVYSNTPVRVPECGFRRLRVEAQPRGYRVHVPEAYRPLLRHVDHLEAADEWRGAFLVDDRRGQMPYIQSNPFELSAMYCYNKVNHIRSLTPVWGEARAD
jgi:hypothetical protein